MLAIALNLVFWCVPLSVICICRLVTPLKREHTRPLTHGIYRIAVRFDNWWLAHISGVTVNKPEMHFDRDQTYVLVSNHRSWIDALLIQYLVATEGPIVVFLTKNELVWVPIFGIIVYAFDFPRMRRRAKGKQSEEDRRAADLARVQDACRILRDSPAAIISLVEGTRATQAKRIDSPYKFLLPPKRGGFSAITQSLQDLNFDLVDITLVYLQEPSLWRFMGGAEKPIQIEAELIDHAELERTGLFRSAGAWLDRLWAAKATKLDSVTPA